MFVAIGRFTNTPASMARAVALLNMIGLFGFAVAVRLYIPSKEREPWLWGLALQAVESLRDPHVEEDLAAVDIDAIPPIALDQPSVPSGPLGGLYLGTGRCLDRPGAPERLVRGGGSGCRHRRSPSAGAGCPDRATGTGGSWARSSA